MNIESRPRILIVDDESYIREFLGEILSSEFQVMFASNGKDAVEVAEKNLPALIVLDLLMPKQDGFKTCESLRKNSKTHNIPIIILTALNDTESRMKAYSLGADDYIEKPFRPDELLVRAKARMGRISFKTEDTKKLACGNLILNRSNRTVKIKQKEYQIMEIEAIILEYLITHQDQICSRESIAAAIWKDEENMNARNLDPHVSSLRKKLSGFDYSIQTAYGAGYVLKRR